MYLTFLLLVGCLIFILSYRRPRYTDNNRLLSVYNIYNRHFYPFHDNISSIEREYINSIINKYDSKKEFENTVDISPYSFSISIEKETGKVNLTRFNIGSVETDIQIYIKRLLEHIRIDDSFCKSGYKHAGVGWDLNEGILKFYTLSADKRKIECHVYKVQRDDRNEITEAVFDTKKIYDVGKKNTCMYKNGKMVNQINLSRSGIFDTHNHIANDLLKKMQRVGFILDTYSEYDGSITLYFD